MARRPQSAPRVTKRSGSKTPSAAKARKAVSPADARKLFLGGERIRPRAIRPSDTLEQVLAKSFWAYNGARLLESCRLFSEKMLRRNVTVGVSLAGALTPAGLGGSCIVPLIEAGFIDWIVSTGANLFHDLHYAFNLPMHRGSPPPAVDDTRLRKAGVVRIYDILLAQDDVLIATDEILRRILSQPEFQHRMGTAELHYRLGHYVDLGERTLGTRGASILAAAYRAGVPVYTSSPGDSAIGMNIAGMALAGSAPAIDPILDVNETAAIVYDAKARSGKSAVLLVGGGSPKNFVLQTEPQIQEILHIPEAGHDYFIQFTDARPDTGGLSGATPSEAVSWGKIDPCQLPDTVVCYVDATVALPILTHYALATHAKRAPKRLVAKREALLAKLRRAADKHSK